MGGMVVIGYVAVCGYVGYVGTCGAAELWNDATHVWVVCGVVGVRSWTSRA